MTEKIVLTKSKIKQLEKELKALEKKRKKAHSESLEEARMSDMSEETDSINAVMVELANVDQRNIGKLCGNGQRGLFCR